MAWSNFSWRKLCLARSASCLASSCFVSTASASAGLAGSCSGTSAAGWSLPAGSAANPGGIQSTQNRRQVQALALVNSIGVLRWIFLLGRFGELGLLMERDLG